MGTHLRVLIKSFPMSTNMAGFRRFSKIFASLCFGKSSLSIGRVGSTQCLSITKCSWDFPGIPRIMLEFSWKSHLLCKSTTLVSTTTNLSSYTPCHNRIINAFLWRNHLYHSQPSPNHQFLCINRALIASDCWSYQNEYAISAKPLGGPPIMSDCEGYDDNKSLLI